MRVLLDTTYALRAPFSGTAIYLQRLQEALGQVDGVTLLPAANTARRPPAGGGLGSVQNLLADTWWSSVALQRLAREQAADVVHHPLPAVAPRASQPQVITVHDLAFERLPGQFDRGFRLYAHHAHRAAARAARAVICVSETTAADVQSLWAVPRERIVVAPLGSGQELRDEGGDSTSEPRHFLYVGDMEPRKNLELLLAAYRAYRGRAGNPLELVLAGRARGSGPGIRTEEAPSPERLGELYRDAAALVHPSLYEGFGLTALEAMSVGTPVLAARSPGLVEVCAEAAVYGDPADPASFAAAMMDIAADATLRRELSGRGRARAAEFSWRECARRHAEAYSLALGA